ncbi:chaperone modulator CbpM [uncultured Winogradskyella sp.]|uniref:chaperone modulator CbpM n=1 Tax=uncultured Winogradskyella sp. TaxID=395353 RepID=UPI00260BCAD9|nr:chaperone modulator CbpM [uncultured Winogradskyella sp.]
METTRLISISQFCTHYNVPASFIDALQDYELIEITITDNVTYLKTNQLNDVEKMIRLHYDLEINLEGIDAIYNLLKKNEELQNEITRLQNRLNFYDDI